MTTTLHTLATQEDSLKVLADLVERASGDPLILRAARQITSDCDARNDMCELEAIYHAVKNGDPRVKGLERGVRYVADSTFADQFNSPARMLAECREGACAGDCDDASALVCALGTAVGFHMGLRAYGPKNGKGYSHVYPVAFVPKRLPKRTVGMDTSVPDAYVGWQPPRGRVMTAMLVPG